MSLKHQETYCVLINAKNGQLAWLSALMGLIPILSCAFEFTISKQNAFSMLNWSDWWLNEFVDILEYAIHMVGLLKGQLRFKTVCFFSVFFDYF